MQSVNGGRALLSPLMFASMQKPSAFFSLACSSLPNMLYVKSEAGFKNQIKELGPG